MAKKKTASPGDSNFKKALEAHRDELREAGVTLSDKALEAIAKVILASA